MRLYNILVFIAFMSFTEGLYAQCCGDGSCDPGETAANCPYDCDTVSLNCPNTIGEFNTSPTYPVNYSTAQANDWCYTVSGPFPQTVCFEYIVPPAGVDASVSLTISGCNTMTTNQANLGGGGCNTSNLTTSDISASATYDSNCDLLNNGVTTGGGNCYTPGDVMTICYTVTGSCGDVEICPVISCGTSNCPTNTGGTSGCPPFNFTDSTNINVCDDGINSGIAVVTPDCGNHFSYLWDDPLAQTDSLATNLSPGVYEVLVTNTALGCDTTYSLVVDTVIPNITDTISAEICQGNSYFAGGSNQTTSGSYNDTLVSVNGCDSIITTNLTVTPSATSIDVHSACEDFTWIDGVTYTSSTNTPTHTIPGGAATGCDSIITLNLTIDNSVSSTDVQTACEDFTWIDGVTYTASTNTPTHTIAGGAAAGCDSVITLDLTINNTATGTDVQSACENFTWIDGVTYTASTNTPTHTIAGGASTGCDSIVTLNLTINNTVTGTDVQTACDDFTWIDGNTYSASTNTPTHTIVGGASTGCDSIVTLDLTINNSATAIDTQTSCESFTWIDGVTYNSSTNTPTHTIVGGAANGCDSTITLDLTINNVATSTDFQTACESFTWIDGVTYTSSTNTPTHTIAGGAANGCDSVITLNLTINNNATATDVQVACGDFTWIDGVTYTESTNTTTHTIVGGASSGCDSTITLDLTINSSSTTINSYTECEGFSVTVENNTYDTTGVYTDIINTCDTIITELTIYPAPSLTLIKADANCEDDNGSVNAEVESDNPPIFYDWDNGSTDSLLENLQAGTYTVTVSDQSGCSTSGSVDILRFNVDCDYYIYIPNIFSPNGDNNNDVLYAKGKGVATFTMRIFNRWGNVVFETGNLDEGWNGIYKGKPQNTGVFSYMVRGDFHNGQTFRESGNITLVR